MAIMIMCISLLVVRTPCEKSSFDFLLLYKLASDFQSFYFLVYDIRDETSSIGTIRISVECLAALQAVEQVCA